MSHLGKAIGSRGGFGRGAAVGDSPDFQRVNALPRRPPPSDEQCAPAVRALTRLYRAPAGKMTLRPIQAWALTELAQAREEGRGILCPMGVGSGKTLVSFLAPRVYDAVRPALFTYASLLEKTRRELAEMSAHWALMPVPHLFTWEMLSDSRGVNLLQQYSPDLIIGDEIHAVKSLQAARTMRFVRYLDDNRACQLVALSGTLTTRGLQDFAHIAALCLGEGSPAPLDPAALTHWGNALNEGVDWSVRESPGVLAQWQGPGESAREGYRRRLVETPGVVATRADALGTGLNITTVRKVGGPILRDFLAQLDATGADPDGNECEDATSRARVAKTMALGYWLRWAWPGGIVNEEWLAARNQWARAVRYYLASGPAPALDSPGRLAAACERGEVPTPALGAAWTAWGPLRHVPPPPVVPRFNAVALAELADWVREWAAPGGLVWVPGPDIGAKLASLTKFQYFPAGVDPSASKAKVIIASQVAHGTGKNLQRWSRNLILMPPASGNAWEQLLGRTHRPGQEADAVEATVCAHHSALRNAWQGARGESAYIQQTTGNPQKLMGATILEE